ncbi:hypothetical protein BJV78DRAFT_1153035 [Lactifluus subvellereus]|nr:hypothetical protein BJV78DRAFT_1153035 [Lactifluus subvellereus]
MDNNDIYFTSGHSSGHSSHQTLPVTVSRPAGIHCPWSTCKVSVQRHQDLGRHCLSFHLPCWIHCPTCFWRGDREEDFNRHLKEQKCGPKPAREQYQIYNTKLILDWVLNDNAPVETAVRYALNFVGERALELGKVEEWRDLWGRQGKRGRHGCCQCEGTLSSQAKSRVTLGSGSLYGFGNRGKRKGIVMITERACGVCIHERRQSGGNAIGTGNSDKSSLSNKRCGRCAVARLEGDDITMRQYSIDLAAVVDAADPDEGSV